MVGPLNNTVISQSDTTELVSTTAVTSESSPLISIDPTASAAPIKATTVALIVVVCALVIVIIVLVVILENYKRKSALSSSKDMSVALPKVNPSPKAEPKAMERHIDDLELSFNTYSQGEVQRSEGEKKRRANQFVRRPVHDTDQEYTNASYIERVNNQDDLEIYEEIIG
ncbi:uncharacterized protein [Watersipora subatra]|uniref:uncharacterized protein n=1 Tax=Watersipora subatra TaxID=2589382 RepID=UPI00355BD10D